MHPLSGVLLPLTSATLQEAPAYHDEPPCARDQAAAVLSSLAQVYSAISAYTDPASCVTTVSAVPRAWWVRWARACGLCPDHAHTHSFAHFVATVRAILASLATANTALRAGNPDTDAGVAPECRNANGDSQQQQQQQQQLSTRFDEDPLSQPLLSLPSLVLPQCKGTAGPDPAAPMLVASDLITTLPSPP